MEINKNKEATIINERVIDIDSEIEALVAMLPTPPPTTPTNPVRLATPPLDIVNIEEMRFNPRLRATIDNVETIFLGGFEEIGNEMTQLRRYASVPVDKFNSFIRHLKGGLDVFSPTYTFNYLGTDGVFDLRPIGSSATYETLVKRVGGFQTPERTVGTTTFPAGTGWTQTPATFTTNVRVDLPFLATPLSLPISYNFSYEVVAKDTIFPLSLRNRASELVYPLQRDFELRNTRLEKKQETFNTSYNSFFNGIDLSESVYRSVLRVSVRNTGSNNYAYVAYIRKSELPLVAGYNRDAYFNFILNSQSSGKFRSSYTENGYNLSDIYLVGEGSGLTLSQGQTASQLASSVKSREFIGGEAIAGGGTSTNFALQFTNEFNQTLDGIFRPIFNERLTYSNLTDENLIRQLTGNVVFSGITSQGNGLIEPLSDFGISTDPTLVSQSTNAFLEDGVLKSRHYGYYVRSTNGLNLDSQLERVNPRDRDSLIEVITNQVGGQAWRRPPSRTGTGAVVVGRVSTFLGIADERLTWRQFAGLSSSVTQTQLRAFLTRSAVNVRILLESSIQITNQENIQRIRDSYNVTQTQAEQIAMEIEEKEQEREEARQREPVNLIESQDGDFPFVSVNAVNLESDSSGNADKLSLVLSRTSQKAPTPSQNFFESMNVKTLDGTTLYSLSFGSADYTAWAKGDEDNPFKNTKVSEYKWDISMTDPPENLDNIDVFNLEFTKSGTSKAGTIQRDYLVQKSTIETIRDKKIDSFINGFRILDFDFSTTSFTLVFEGRVLETDFSSVRVLDKEGKSS